MSTLAEVAIKDFEEKLSDAVAEWHPRGSSTRNVTVRRRGQRWTLEVSLGRLKLSDPKLALSVSGNLVTVGSRRVALPSADILEIVQTVLKPRSFQLIVAEAERVIETADADIRAASTLLAQAAARLRELEPLRQVAAARALRGIEELLEHASVELVQDAASKRTDFEVLLRALESPEAIEFSKLDDPLAAARLRGLRERDRLATVEGGTMSADEVASHLHLTRQAVNLRRQNGTLLALAAGRHGFRYPAWQFVHEGVLAGLEPVLATLSHLAPWSQQAFMVSANRRLEGQTPLEVIRLGRVDQVVAAARAYGEHGAA